MSTTTQRPRKSRRGAADVGECPNYFRDPDVAEQVIREIPEYDPYAQAGECYFNAEAAGDAVDFFHFGLKHVKGELAGKPFRLQRWQQAIIGNLFGWKRPDGLRRYRNAFIAVPRKNGKSPTAAGLALRLLLGEAEPGAEIIGAASTRDQARLVWDWARGMLRRCPVLGDRVKIFQHSIVLRDDPLANYKPIAAEAGGIHGANLHGAVIDELHTLPSRELVDVIKSSTIARREPLVVEITTAGWDIESICYEEWQTAKAVRAGVKHDPELLPCVWEAPADANWQDPAVWAAANPNLGVSVKRDWMEAQCKRAAASPALEYSFRQLNLNQWVGSASAWFSLQSWRACDGTFDLASMAKQPCYAGLDLGRTEALAAFALCFPMGDGSYRVAVWHFMPNKDIRHREEIDRAKYSEWARDGLLKLTAKNATDFRAIKERIAWAIKTFKVKELAYDRWEARELIAQIEEEFGVETFKHGQGMAGMSGPVKEVERLVLDRQLAYNQNPMLDWQMLHCATATDKAGNRIPDKMTSRGWIDGIVAMIMAVGRAVVLSPKRAGAYTTRGIRELSW